MLNVQEWPEAKICSIYFKQSLISQKTTRRMQTNGIPKERNQAERNHKRGLEGILLSFFLLSKGRRSNSGPEEAVIRTSPVSLSICVTEWGVCTLNQKKREK